MGIRNRFGSLLILALLLAGSRSVQAQGAARVADLPRTSSVDAEARLAIIQLAAGTVPDGLEAIEQQLLGRPGRGSLLRAITELGFAFRGTGPVLRATSQDLGTLLLVYQAAHDSAGVRETIRSIDAARSRMATRNLPPPVGLAEAERFLGDSAAALARLVAFEASSSTMERSVSWGAVQNGWLLGRGWRLLGDLAAAMGRPVEAQRARERTALEDGQDRPDRPDHPDRPLRPHRPFMLRTPINLRPTRVRYDAVLWMQPVAGNESAERPLARLGFLATEQTRRTAVGFATTQTYDSIIVDMPMLEALGAEGLALRRRIQSAAGLMSATTLSDSVGRVSARTLENAASLPGEMRGLLERGIGFGPLATAMIGPTDSVSLGDSWTDSIALMIPGAGETALVIPARYRLARITSGGGRRLAFITIEAGSGVTRPMADGSRVDVRLTGELVRDLESGETLRLAASLRATVRAATGAVMPVRVLLTALREADAAPATIALR